MPLRCLKAVPDGVELVLHIQPRASRSQISGLHGDALKVQLAAPPVDGAANDALVALAAGLFGLPKRAVTLVSGHASRKKRLHLQGVDAAAAEAVIKSHL